jgi:anthranilate synthase/aminodeoxychorismate synthase-like glutamine amidotransferase
MKLKQNKRVLLLDNSDAFTNNIAQLFINAGAEVLASRNDELTIEDAKELNPTHLFLTPGNGTYDIHGLRHQKFVHEFHQDIPISGVCLGHQCIAAYFGAKIDSNVVPLRGIETECQHDGEGLFSGIPTPFNVGRYHNDVVNPDLKGTPLVVSAWSDGLVMAIRHTTLPIESFQIHPESSFTRNGHGSTLIENFLKTP